MTKPKHVPECFNGRQRSGGLPCICDRLRACEQRVMDDTTRWEPHYLAGQAHGYARGLDAAREAVDAVWIHASEALDPLDPRTFTDTLAAIDALRGEA